MKYILGSIMISSMILFVCILILGATGLQLPESIKQHTGYLWVALTALCYPAARKLVR